MIDIVGKKLWYFAFSLAIIISGLASVAIWGLNLGIDFTGGSLLEIKFEEQIDKSKLEEVVGEAGTEVVSITPTQEQRYIIRTKPLEKESRQNLQSALREEFGNVEIVSLETIGPTIGQELLRKAVTALVVAAIAIILYVAWAFRSVPKPASSWRFGVIAIITLLHDVLIVFGSFAILGRFFGATIDALFVTALLTIIGFSVHDTIVVFDRIRENLNKRVGENFASTVNHSIMQTITRSVNTSFTVILVLIPIILFGGATLKWFTLALLIGVISGTYSSIFTAAPLLVVWQDWSQKRSSGK